MNRNFFNSLSDKDKEKIKFLYEIEKISCPKIAEEFNISTSAMYRTMNKLGIIRQNNFFDRLSNNDKEKIRYLYEIEKLSILTIAKQFNVSDTTMTKILKELNITIRSINCLYEIDSTFFQKIDTEEKAYWLGFMYADGYICRRNNKIFGFGIGLSIVDQNHLEKFKQSLKSTHPIKIREETIIHNNEYNKDYICNKSVNLSIGNIQITQDLINLGCVPAKSLILKYPTESQVPLKLQHHFIRGYFDGDGSIEYSNLEQKYIRLSIIGTENFLNGVKNFINPDYVCIIYKELNKKTYQFRIANKEGMLDFYNKIYKDSNVVLERKFQKFEQFNNDYNDKFCSLKDDVVKEI